jgi:hypothetical protein
MRPLNEGLYEVLLEVFGNVHLRNEGQKHSVLPSFFYSEPEAIVPDPAPPEANGENYAVACPFCNTFLVLNHRWGVRDPRTGVADLAPARCNSRCFDKPGRREQLLELISRGYRRQERGYRSGRDRWSPGWPSYEGAEEWSEADRISRPTQEFTLPPLREITPLNTLSPSHPAVSYLTSQGFDPDEIATCWGVSYWEEKNDWPRTIPRLLIPIYDVRECSHWQTEPHLAEPVLLGWVARALGPLDPGFPEVLSCRYTRKSHIVYGRSGPLAFRESGYTPSEDPRWKALCERFTESLPLRLPRILVEEPEDVWRLGEHAVGVFGSELSGFQSRVLWHTINHFPLVVFFNRGSRAAAESAERMIWQTRPYDPCRDRTLKLIAIAELPAGRDAVRQCTPEEAWDGVFAALSGTRRRR